MFQLSFTFCYFPVFVYSKRKKADWEVKEDYCKGVKTRPPFHQGRLLLDLIDLHILDFLTGYFQTVFCNLACVY